ncbi:MAG: 30S ribosomal protein S21 [bacterium]
MAKVEIRKEESIDKALRKFKMKLRKEGVLDELKKREYYEKPSEKKRHNLEKAKRKEARRRQEEW